MYGISLCAKEVHVYLQNIYVKFQGLSKILSKNESELSELGIILVDSSPYYPYSNECIEWFHNVLKVC